MHDTEGNCLQPTFICDSKWYGWMRLDQVQLNLNFIWQRCINMWYSLGFPTYMVGFASRIFPHNDICRAGWLCRKGYVHGRKVIESKIDPLWIFHLDYPRPVSNTTAGFVCNDAGQHTVAMVGHTDLGTDCTVVTSHRNNWIKKQAYL